MRRTQIIQLGPVLYGVYPMGVPFSKDTPVLFRGTFEECQQFRREYETQEAA